MLHGPKNWIWMISLVVGSLFWARMVDVQLMQSRGIQDIGTFFSFVGKYIGMAGIPLAITAIIALFIVLILKKRHLFLFLWTILQSIVLVCLSVGALKLISAT